MDVPHRNDGGPADVAGPQGPLLLGRYRVERTLGRGGMGEVHLAHDTLLGRRVALKRLRGEGAAPAQLRSAILKEARRASRINDPRIAAIHDVVEHHGEVLLVMEYIDGVTLRERMTRPVPLDEFWSLATQCVDAVAVAHAHGLIHRDIKPENLMVTGAGRIKVLDFGIAKRTGLSANEQNTSALFDSRTQVVGTPQYMAPEAHLGGPIDERTDVFALGVVFYELLTGRQPFDGPTYGAVLEKVLNASPPPVLETHPAAGAALSRVVERMLAKDPAARFASSAELSEHLLAARDGRNVGGGPAHAAGAAAIRRERARPSVMVGVALGASSLIWFGDAAAPALPVDRHVALLAPATPGASADFGSWALGAVEMLAGRLERHTDTPGLQLASFTEGLDERVRSADDAGKVLGATIALVPTLEQTPNRLRARLELMDTARNRVIAMRTVETPASQPFAFLDRTYGLAAMMLGVTARRRDAQSELGMRGAGTLRFYLQGMGRARSARTAAELREAAENLEVACRTEPEAALARAGLSAAQLKAHLLAQDGEWLRLAEASAREAVALDGARPEPHRILGAVLVAAKRPEDATAELARAVELNPTDDDACYRLARMHARRGQPELEKEVYLAAIERRPHAWQPRWWLATWHFRDGNVDESIRAYEEMVRRAPGLHKGYSSLGGLLVLSGDYTRAIRTLRRAVELRPTRVAFDNLGTAYFNSGEFHGAIDAYNQAFQFGLADYASWLNLGDAFLFSPRHGDAEAVKAFGQAVRLGRDEITTRAQRGSSFDPMIAANLATVFPKLGQPDSARVYLNRALAVAGTNPMVAFAAALTHWRLDERDRAVVWLGRAVDAGYPIVWVRDSPIFREWREVPEFRALVGEIDPGTTMSLNQGGRP